MNEIFQIKKQSKKNGADNFVRLAKKKKYYKTCFASPNKMMDMVNILFRFFY